MGNERIFIFIDGSNLDRAVDSSFHRRINVQRLAEKLVAGRRLMKVHYYEAPLLENVNPRSFATQQTFFASLRQNPFWGIRLGRRVQRDREVTCSECGKVSKNITWEQKGVDTLLVLDLVTLAIRNVYDTAILVAGDQDYIEPVLQVKMLGKIVENAFTLNAWAPALRNVVDNSIVLDDRFLSDCWE